MTVGPDTLHCWCGFPGGWGGTESAQMGQGAPTCWLDV